VIKTKLIEQATSGALAQAIKAPVLGLQETPKEVGVAPTLLQGSEIPPAPKVVAGVTAQPDSYTSNTMNIMENGVHKSSVSFAVTTSKEGQSFYMNHEVSLQLLGTDKWQFAADKDSSAFEIDSCINDGTGLTPLNCVYTMMPATTVTQTEQVVYTYQKHVTQADLPTSSAQTKLTEVAAPSCTVSQKYQNGRTSQTGAATTLGTKVTTGSVTQHTNCELMTQGTELTATGVKNRVKILLSNEAAATAIKTNKYNFYVKAGYSITPGTWISVGGQTYSLVDTSPATLVPKANQQNVFELKQGEKTKAEVLLEATITPPAALSSKMTLKWDFWITLTDSLLSFPTDGDSSVFELDACIRDNTGFYSWRCVYAQMRGVGPNVNTVTLTVFEQLVHDADKPSTSAFIAPTPFTNNRCMVAQSFYNGKSGTVFVRQAEGFTEINGCTFLTSSSLLDNRQAKISFKSE